MGRQLLHRGVKGVWQGVFLFRWFTFLLQSVTVLLILDYGKQLVPSQHSYFSSVIWLLSANVSEIGQVLSLVFLHAVWSLFCSCVLHINLSVSLILYPGGAFITSSSVNWKHMNSEPIKQIQDVHQTTNHRDAGELSSHPEDRHTLWKCKSYLGIMRRSLNHGCAFSEDKVLQYLQVQDRGSCCWAKLLHDIPEMS